MTDPATVSSPKSSHDPSEKFLRRYTAFMLSCIAAAMGWTLMQAVDVRDTVHNLQATVPLQIQSINQRVDRVEANATRFDDRLTADEQRARAN